MMAITTNSSTSVKAKRPQRPGEHELLFWGYSAGFERNETLERGRLRCKFFTVETDAVEVGGFET